MFTSHGMEGYMDTDSIDARLMGLLQTDFPLVSRPYLALGTCLGVSEDEVIHQVARLKERGVVRQISPVLDARRLGIKTTLVAMRVPEERLDEAARALVEHPGVSHGYEREHYMNLWFTLAVAPGGEFSTELEKIAGNIGADDYFDLPATRLFKIGTYFGMDDDGQPASCANARGMLPPAVALSCVERVVINELQQDLPLIPKPFAGMAANLGMDEASFLEKCRSLLERGVMRRFGAAINHRKAGFQANGMLCMEVSQERVEAMGRRLASIREVSHCYERKTNPFWKYNLFAMAHGRTRETCREIADNITVECGLPENILLFSTRELKKERVKYLV